MRVTAIPTRQVESEFALDTIVRNMQPHVICFQEVGASANNSSYLLNNALNTGSTSSWSTTNYTNNSFSSLTNVIAYRNDILGLISQDVISKISPTTTLFV